MSERQPPDGEQRNSLSSTEREALQAELTRRYNNLAILQSQAAKHGIDVPLSLANQIAEQESRIAAIEARLMGKTDELSVAARYFSQGARAHIQGDLWEAKRYYEMALNEDPFYPRAQEQLDLLNGQLLPPSAAPSEPPGCLASISNIFKGRTGMMLWLFIVFGNIILIRVLTTHLF